jgi:hypothetical protein
MAPVMSLADSRARAEEALRMRVRRRTWGEISEALGYKSRGGARLAVRRLMSKMVAAPGADRALSSEALLELQRGLFERFDAAVSRGDDVTAVSVARELRCLVTDNAKMSGIYAPERTEVDVTVHESPREIVAEATARLLALVDQRSAAERERMTNVVDGEVISVEQG